MRKQPRTPAEAQLNTLSRNVNWIFFSMIALWGTFWFVDWGYMHASAANGALVTPQYSPFLRGLVATIPIALVELLSTLGLPPKTVPLSLRVLTRAPLVFTFLLNFVWSLGLLRYLEIVTASSIAVIVSIPVLVLWLGQKNFLSMYKLVRLPVVAAPNSRVVACHLSDAHVTRDQRISVEGHRHCWRNLVSAVEQIGELRPQFLFCTGDFTDSGQAEEWEGVMNQLAMLKGTKIFLIPGNHDLNTVYSDDDVAKSAKLFERFIVNASMLVDDLEIHSGEKLRRLLADFEASVPPRLEEVARRLRDAEIKEKSEVRFFMGAPSPRASWSELHMLYQSDWRRWEGAAQDEIRKAFFATARADWFPLICRDSDLKTCVVILNSVPVTLTLGEGALGEWGKDQLERLKLVLSRLESSKFLWILTHHAPFRRWDDSISRLGERWNYALLSHQIEEAGMFTNHMIEFAVRNPHTEVNVLCGHRHKRDAGLCGMIRVFESDALGTNEKAGWIFPWRVIVFMLTLVEINAWRLPMRTKPIHFQGLSNEVCRDRLPRVQLNASLCYLRGESQRQ